MAAENAMSGPVAVLGVGMHPWGLWKKSFHEYACHAARAALDDAGLSLRDVGVLVAAGTARCGYDGNVAGALICRQLGIRDVETITVYGACASGAMALKVARDRILAGECDTALVVGADIGKPTNLGNSVNEGSDSELDRSLQLQNVAYLGLRAMRRMHDFGTTQADLHHVRVKNSSHGVGNPMARFRLQLTENLIEASPLVASPLRLLHVSTFSDGAAAVLIGNNEYARTHSRSNVSIRAISLSTAADGFEPPFRSAQLASSSASERAANVARSLTIAGIGPSDVSLVELYDVSSVSELDWYEHIGLCREGDAENLLRSGRTSIQGDIPVNPSGGLTSFGEAVAAQALAQVCEITRQLRRQSGPRQVTNPMHGLAVCDGLFGHIASIVLSQNS